jgi:hypothetical protein
LNPVLLTRKEIEAHSWDSFVAHSRQSVIYGFSWYLDIVCEDWNALVWPSASDFRIVMPLPFKNKFGFPILYQPHFCQYLGIFSCEEISEEDTSAFLSACSAHFSYISSYSFHPDNYNVIHTALSSSAAWEYEIHKTVWLSLNISYNDISKNYSKDRQKNLRKSNKWGWTVQSSKNIEPLIDLFRENHAAQIEGGVSEKSYRVLKEIFKQTHFRECVELRYAVLGDSIHAGTLILRKANFATYIFNAADSIGRTGNARTALLNDYFKENAESDLVFDFESPQLQTIHSFYQSFGENEVPFITIYKRSLPFPLRQFQLLRRSLIKAKRDLCAILCKI